MRDPGLRAPLVSVILFCRNSAPTIRRAVDSVLNGSYAHVELIVQDGQSTDGTFDILEGYRDERIKLVSEPDQSASDAFRKALRRCTGAFIGSCLADEELLPDAIVDAVSYLNQHGSVGAVTGDTLITDDAGAVKHTAQGAPFDLIDYLLGRCTPYFVSSFFSRRALDEIGFFTDDIVYDCFEFELWCRLGTEHTIFYLPRAMAKYAVHDEQLSNTPRAMMPHIDGRAAVIDRLFSNDGFFGENPKLRDHVILSQYKMFYAHAVTYGLRDMMAALEPRIAAISVNVSEAEFATSWVKEQATRRTWLAFGNALPPALKRWILGKGLHRPIRPAFLAITRRFQGAPRQAEANAGGVDLAIRAELAIHCDTALLYHGRGQIEEALAQWRRVETLDNVEIDSLACQAAQRAPSVNAKDLLAIQRRWARRHADWPAVAPRAMAQPWLRDRPLKVGYHCAWWDSPLARHQLLNFIRRHTRSRVLPHGYSPIPAPSDVTDSFTAFRITGQLSDEEFAALARSDGLDVLVETTGFSPFHRYAAMAHRGAPVQISYLNHHATTAVQNVDYVLGDSVVAEGPDGAYFTETVYALPGCFFCFDLRDEDIPLRSEPPCLDRGFVTFGCFGTGGKINMHLIELWSAILNRVPGARLLLRNRELTPVNNRRFMERRFARFGIGRERLVLMPGVDHATILQNYDDIDISLDTWPYCGGNTIAESFWQGVPVVTLLGDRFSARYGASLVRAHGCPELVANSMGQYVTIAVELATDRARLADYRRLLRNLAARSGFNDSQGFARKLEAAYADMRARVS